MEAVYCKDGLEAACARAEAEGLEVGCVEYEGLEVGRGTGVIWREDPTDL